MDDKATGKANTHKIPTVNEKYRAINTRNRQHHTQNIQKASSGNELVEDGPALVSARGPLEIPGTPTHAAQQAEPPQEEQIRFADGERSGSLTPAPRHQLHEIVPDETEEGSAQPIRKHGSSVNVTAPLIPSLVSDHVADLQGARQAHAGMRSAAHLRI